MAIASLGISRVAARPWRACGTVVRHSHWASRADDVRTRAVENSSIGQARDNVRQEVLVDLSSIRLQPHGRCQRTLRAGNVFAYLSLSES
jgi:hypothetical protein